jgi:hypothetical protein
MDDQADAHADRPLSVHLDLYLDRQPVSGRLRTEWGGDERFVGWLGFADALKRLREQQAPSADRAAARHTPADAATTQSPPHRKEPP